MITATEIFELDATDPETGTETGTAWEFFNRDGQISVARYKLVRRYEALPSPEGGYDGNLDSAMGGILADLDQAKALVRRIGGTPEQFEAIFGTAA